MNFLQFFRRLFNKIKIRWQNRPLKSTQFDFKLIQRTKSKRFPSWQQIRQVKRFFSKEEKIIFNISLIVFIVSLCWFGLVLAKSNRIQVPKAGGIYIEGEVGSPQSVNPIFASANDVDKDITQLVYSGLMRYDDQLRLVPDLAVRYTISDDKKVYNFELRKDVLWHDGEKFTAKDIVFTINAIQNLVMGSPLSSAFQGVVAQAVDDYNIKFTLSQPYAPFLSVLTLGILPEHVWQDIEPQEMRFAQANLQNPVGTGPFMFRKMAKDGNGHIYQYELTRFEKYYRQTAYLQSFVFQFFPAYDGDSGAIEAFRQQKVNGLSYVPYNLRDKVNRKHIDIHTLQLPQYTALFFNQDQNASLKDKNVRLALASALDKAKIIKDVLNGEGQMIDSPVLPIFSSYNPDVKKINYSLDDANKLLDQKWPRVTATAYRNTLQEKMLKDWQNSLPKGTTTTPEMQKDQEKKIIDDLNKSLPPAQTFFRQDKQGNLLEINLVTVDDEQYKKVAGLVAGFWQEVGVKTNVKFVSKNDIGRDVLKPRAYDVLLYGEIVGNDPDPYPFWHSSQVDFPGLNLARFSNKDADNLIEKARSSFNPEEQKNLYKKFQDLIVSEMPAIFLYMPTYTYATDDSIKGVDITKIFEPADRFADIINWYLKTKGQWSF